jgi:hypothetical protein
MTSQSTPPLLPSQLKQLPGISHALSVKAVTGYLSRQVCASPFVFKEKKTMLPYLIPGTVLQYRKNRNRNLLVNYRYFSFCRATGT